MSDYETPSSIEEYEERRIARRKQRLFKKIRFFLIIAAVLFLALLVLFSGGTRKSAEIEIPAGSSTKKIGQILKSEGVIPCATVFSVKALTSPYKGKLKYGTFTIEKGMSYSELLELLATQGAKKETVTVTIPEGFSAENIITRFVDAGIADREAFESAMTADYDFDFLKHIPEKDGCRYRLQGFLFPSTYEFYQDATAETVISTMLSEFEKQSRALNIDADKLYQTMILASLIEREAKLDSERATISGVIKNRLAQSQKLQIDATVVYAVSEGTYDLERVLYRHLETDSPYNTYKYSGLPVGPICSPGLKSIEAALNPEKHEYLYYHTDTEKNDGSHIFTKTFQEHKKNK